MRGYIKLARPKSWLKNVFIFVPIVFSLDLFNLDHLLKTAVAFASFCLVASGVYAFNDVCDAEKDARHPIKSKRPIPAGLISKRAAVVYSVFLVITGTAVCMALNMFAGALIAAYIALNISYSLKLKHVPIIDCFCIAAGFILRIYIGSVAGGEPVSNWLFLTVVTMSLFMAFGKRHGEASEHYSRSFLQGIVFTCAGLTIVFYSLWALGRGHHMIYTVPLIIFITAKYLTLINSPDSQGDPTTVIFGDKVLLVSAGVYGIITIALLYAWR